MGTSFRLITGRTVKQAVGMHKGKDSRAYRAATTLVEMNAEDMEAFGIREGQMVRLCTIAGRVEVPARTGEVPRQVVFVPMGPVANLLIGAGTGGTGMPSFKGMAVEIEAI